MQSVSKTDKVSNYEVYLNSDRHFYIFVQTNLALFCTFCRLQNMLHNLKPHSINKSHCKTLKYNLLQKILRSANF